MSHMNLQSRTKLLAHFGSIPLRKSMGPRNKTEQRKTEKKEKEQTCNTSHGTPRAPRWNAWSWTNLARDKSVPLIPNSRSHFCKCSSKDRTHLDAMTGVIGQTPLDSLESANEAGFSTRVWLCPDEVSFPLEIAALEVAPESSGGPAPTSVSVFIQGLREKKSCELNALVGNCSTDFVGSAAPRFSISAVRDARLDDFSSADAWSEATGIDSVRVQVRHSSVLLSKKLHASLRESRLCSLVNLDTMLHWGSWNWWTSRSLVVKVFGLRGFFTPKRLFPVGSLFLEIATPAGLDLEASLALLDVLLFICLWIGRIEIGSLSVRALPVKATALRSLSSPASPADCISMGSFALDSPPDVAVFASRVFRLGVLLSSVPCLSEAALLLPFGALSAWAGEGPAQAFFRGDPPCPSRFAISSVASMSSNSSGIFVSTDSCQQKWKKWNHCTAPRSKESFHPKYVSQFKGRQLLQGWWANGSRRRGNMYMTSLPLVSFRCHSPWPWERSERRATISSSVFRVHNWCFDKCIELTYRLSRLSFLAQSWRRYFV